MDINKEKLKNRLNVKFQPFKANQQSLKKLNLPDRQIKDHKDNHKETNLLQHTKNRSISQLKLPSLEKKVNISRFAQEKTQEIINIREMKQRINSIKILPTIKVESKQPVDNTLTFLMRNQILNIPKIVALLMKTQSQQFLYMRIKGIYEFQVCNEQEKGSNYITVSKNGMVRDGELIPLEKLTYQYDIFNKLKKIHYYKNFILIRFLNKWKKGFKQANFYENKLKIRKVFEENESILKWKIELKNILYIPQMNGNLTSGWVKKIALDIEDSQEIVQKRLLAIVNKLLQKFQLPISENFDLMNKVLSNLVNLNLNFQKKFRIQRCLQMTYQLGRMLQFYSLQSIGYFIVNHLDQIVKKFRQKNQNYITNILQPIQKLKITNTTYVTQKQRILLATSSNEQINFKMIFNHLNKLQIQPSISSIVQKIQKDIKDFILQVQRKNYKIIRTQKFNFITNNIIKEEIIQDGTNIKDITIKQYVYSINVYFQKLKELDQETQNINQTIKRKISLLSPFYQVYLKYNQKINQQKQFQYTFYQMEEQLQSIEKDIEFVKLKLHDGEYFLFGYMSHLQIKQEINETIKIYKEMLINSIPGKIRHNKQLLMQTIIKSLQILRIVIKSPDEFIKVSIECQDLQQKISDYVSNLIDIEQLQNLYLKIKKIETNSLVEEKNVLAQIKMKLKNYKDTKQNSYLLYKKSVQNMKKQLIARIQNIIPYEAYYEINNNYEEMYNNCSQNNNKLIKLTSELKHLNELQGFFDIKITSIPKLQTLVLKFQSLEDIWYMRKQYQREIQELLFVNIMKIMGLPLIKKYQTFLRKIQGYKKDPDYYKLSIYLLQKIPAFLNTIYLVVDLQNVIFRPQDLDQITTLFTKQYKIDRHVSTYSFSIIYNNLMYQIRQLILQISFKSHKQQQIEKLIKQFQNWWKNIRLQGQYLQQYPLIIIFNDNDQLRKEIQEYSLILLNIINHKYGTFARKQCNQYLRNIGYLAGLLELAISHQEKFLNLFPILTSRYAEKQIPSQYKRFSSILEKTMKNVKWLIKPTENLNQNTRLLLNNHIKQFDAISKVLSHFLERKRVKFQRFYFLQDDQLLQVLVGISGQNTIFRMFDGIKGWLVDKEGIKYGVQGIGGEHLNLRGWSYKQQQPQVIFKYLQDSIKINLNSIVRNILQNYEIQLKQLKNLYPNMPWMCVYTVELILFTKQMQINCFQNGINISLQISLISENIKSSVSNALQNSNYITLQLFLLHFAEQLRHQNVNNVFDFKWHSFLRYYFQKDAVIMRSMGTDHIWGGQYQGLWNLMINTSDIRRAHTSILSNIKHCNGVLLQGPSGTGKTQSLKELARNMAKYCVIFNCSSQVNIRTLQKLLSGLCYTGSWICLDQINRLTSQIMSVVANQINSIKNAIVQNKEVFSFMGKDMKLKKGVGIFSTMNPIYLKRAKLTQNLKSFFRIISVNIPDYEKILEVMLYSLGITSSSKYSHQISLLFKSLSIQLSLRSQYDFGLRAMKTFILNLSMIKTSVKNDEEAIVEALYKTFYSRLQQSDKQTFFKVISDVFNKKIKEKEKDYKLFIMKQAPQTGIIILGPTSTKTTLINKFLSLYDKRYLHLEVFNPNSLQLKYFLGQNQLGKWQQGIVEKMAKGSFQNKNQNYILVLDSRLKSQTIQNFNTLLDESKMLSLSNGTRLKIYNNFKLIMQTPDLQMTSPATITRCNVVYLNESDVPKSDVITNYLPILTNKEIHHKIHQILNLYTLPQIHKIINISNVIFSKKINKNDELTLSQCIGLQKSIIFAIHILGLSQRIKRYINKDNSIPPKKNIFNFYLQFNKFHEGQIIQLDTYVNKINLLNNTYIYTLKDRFYEYINTKAYNNQQNVLWKGLRMSGKTSAIKYSLEAIFKNMPQNKNILKLIINSHISSKIVTGLIDEKVIHNQEVEDEKKVIIYIDDIHLANEEISQFIRYSSQYKKIFNYKTKQLAKLVKHTIIADTNNDYSKEFVSRFNRHFAEINVPNYEDYVVRSIFTMYSNHMIMSSRIPADIKISVQIELQKIVQFLMEYIKINNNNYKQAFEDDTATSQSMQYLSFCHLLPILRNFSVLHPSICKQIPDLITFLFSQLRSQQIEHRFCAKQIDFIKLAYSQTFKYKFQKQYDKTLKSINGYPHQSIKYTTIKGKIEIIQNWQQFKNELISKLQQKYYVSQFILVQIMKFLRVLQWNTGHYYLVGNPGLGKRTMLKIGVSLTQKELIDTLPTQQKKISQWYFNLIKNSFQYRKQYTILIDLDNHQNDLTIRYLQKIQNGYPILQLISNENCQYCYNCISQHKQINYDKYSKPYNEVIQDFILISKKKIQILFFSDRKALNNFHLDYHYLYQQTYLRIIEEFPSESIVQISNQILQLNLNQNTDKRGLTNIFLKLYKDLVALMRENQANNKNYFKYNVFYHFKVINRFIKNYKLVIEKSKFKEDILNRSILKIHEISQTLERLKVQLKQIQPKVRQKTQKLLQVIPILEQKKKMSEQVKVVVINEKKEIQQKNNEIQEMVKIVQQKIKNAQSILQEANDSVQTIKRSQLSQLRNNANPHPLIKFTLQNMAIILGQNSQSWDNIKKVLSDTSLMPKLKSAVPTLMNIQKLRKRINQNPDWNFDSISKISFGVRYMVKWIKNVIKFYQLKYSLDNQKLKVENYKNQLIKLQEKLSKKQKELDDRQSQVRIVQDQYKFFKNQLMAIQQLMALNNKKYQNAQIIKNHLHQQINNWYDQLNIFKNLKKNSQSNALKITFYLQIFSSITVEEEKKLDKLFAQYFVKYGFSHDLAFNPLEFIKENILNNLDSDNKKFPLSLENLSIQDAKNGHIIQAIYHLKQRPILLDPDNQALNWIQRQLANQPQNGIKVIITKQTFVSSIKNVELAMRQGYILILLIQDELDPFTQNILASKITDNAGSKIIQYNKNILTLNENFRLLMCNKSRNPNLSNNLYINHIVLNFQITKNILKSMLLHELIMIENKESYTIQKELQVEKKANKKVVREIEEQIIQSLINSKKNLIQNNQFIQLLGQSQAKRMLLKINESQSKQKSYIIKKIHDQFQSVTQNISQIYMSLKPLSKLNQILSWNSQIFVQYFVQAVKSSIFSPLFEEDDYQEVQIKQLKQSNFQFDHYSLSLGNSNSRPTSALSFVSGVTSKVVADERKDDFQEEHPTSIYSFQNLIGHRQMVVDEAKKGTMSAQRQANIRNLMIDYIKSAFTQKQRIIWGLILCFDKYDLKDMKILFQLKAKRNKLKQYLDAGQLPDRLSNYLKTNSDKSDEYYRDIFISSSNPFHKFAQVLSQIQILLFCKLICPNRFYQLCIVMIKNKGFSQILKYSQTKTLDWFQRSDNIHPILLIMGEDPITRISDYLTKRKYKNVILMPMGEGQNKIAQIVLEKQSRRQNLLIIHNLQISQNFLIFLSKMLQQFQIKPPHPNFRLILISTVFDQLNEQITSYCHKYLIEQPMGVKNQIKYLRQINNINLVHPYHKKIQFVITYMHSILNNLSRFKPYGWNMKYDFHSTQFLKSIVSLKQIAESPLNIENYQCNIDLQQQKIKAQLDVIDFKALKYIIGEIGYIGKLSDDIDRAKMSIIVSKYINPNIFEKNTNQDGIKNLDFSCLQLDKIESMIQEIDENNSEIFGLNKQIKPSSQNASIITQTLQKVYYDNNSILQNNAKIYKKFIEPINHKFQFINKEIQKFNSGLEMIKIYGENQILLEKIKNGYYLSTITPVSKIYHLKAFSNPREFFISIIKDIAYKHNVVYDKVQLVWSVVPKDNITGNYGISNLKLQGGTLHGNTLQDGVQQKNVTLYVQGVVKKKDKQTRKLVSIPLYLEEERQGQINSYGHNTNLLTRVKLQASQPQQFWILHSTAFIVT